MNRNVGSIDYLPPEDLSGPVPAFDPDLLSMDDFFFALHGIEMENLEDEILSDIDEDNYRRMLEDPSFFD